MNKSQKIYFNSGNTVNDNNIKVRLEQDVDTLEFLSMKIDTKEVYQDFNADYGVVVGRVLVNGGVGVPNAKISVFIPLTEEDAEDARIYRLYPYKTPRDKNTEGKRYNLLPRVSKRNPDTQEIQPKQAFGSFPIKEEIVTNEPFLNVYKKYYKYTATTNEAGDYMIFGVPIGTQTVHLSVDITDIGEYSMTPAAMVVNLGYPESSFTNNNTRIKETSDLTDLPHIETQEVSVDVVPFWGDVENFEIGITRQDFRIRAVLTNTFTLFGTSFSDNAISMRGSTDDTAPNQREVRDYFTIFPNTETETANDDWFSMGLANKRITNITEKIYYYPADISDEECDIGGTANPEDDMQILDSSEYSMYKRNGDFVFIINCNRRKVITDDDGNQFEVSPNNTEGIFTEFRGFVTLEYTLDDAPMISNGYLDASTEGARETTRTAPLRLRFKFPQHAEPNSPFVYDQTSTKNDYWRSIHMKFEAQKFYSISTFLPTLYNDEGDDSQQFGLNNKFFAKDVINNAQEDAGRQNIGAIHVQNVNTYNNSDYDMVENTRVTAGGTTYGAFGANWLNFCVYFQQIGYTIEFGGRLEGVRVSDFLAPQWRDENDKNTYFIFDNSMPIAAGDVNAKWFGRSDLHWTDIIEVPLADIKEFKTENKGFKLSNAEAQSLIGNEYRNGNIEPNPTDWKGDWVTACPLNGGKEDGIPTNPNDTDFYFYKGFDTADCIQYLYDLGLVT